MRRWLLRPSLARKFTLLSLIPIVALGFVLARVLQAQIVTRAVDDASQSAQLLARLGIQPRLSPSELRNGLSAAQLRALDTQLQARSATRDLARIKIWNTRHMVVYSDDHQLIGRTFAPSDDLQGALEGKPNDAEVVTPSPHGETASEVGLGQLVEVYVPLRFKSTGAPAGAFEIYLSYAPIAAAISHDKRTIALLVFCGLALLWAILYRIVARASRTLRLQARENDRLARYDQLTGLPNRTLFIESSAAALASARRSGATLAVLLLDLDCFKDINDTLGHPTGDAVLREVGNRLRSQLSEETLVARLGADEYAILDPHVRDVADALRTAAVVQSALELPVTLDGVALNIDASIGLALSPLHAESQEALLRCADVALDRAKAQRSRVEVYRPEHDRFTPARLKLLGQVRPALARGEFILHYQPKADVHSGRITGVEALLRWRHPEQGLVPPLEFIPLIEQTALVGPVTLYVVDHALAQLARWRELGMDLSMSVNLSARNLLDPELAQRIGELLARHTVPAERLIVEVTESSTMADPERAVAVLDALRAQGVGVSIDDFGTGNASIAYLTKLPASELKIDRSFVTGMCASPREEAIVRSTIDLARHLDMHVVAEGIETNEVLERLADLGCHTAQGYLISRPLPGEELTAWLGGRVGSTSAVAPSIS